MAINTSSHCIDLIGHCSFCLRQLSPIENDPLMKKELEVIPVKTIMSFPHLWRYFFETGNIHREETKFHFVHRNRKSPNLDCSDCTKYSKVPPMCFSCKDVLYGLEGLVRKLIKVVEKVEKCKMQVKQILANSLDQVSLFERRLQQSHDVGSSCSSKTIDFIKILRVSEFANEENRVQVHTADGTPPISLKVFDIDKDEMDSNKMEIDTPSPPSFWEESSNPDIPNSKWNIIPSSSVSGETGSHLTTVNKLPQSDGKFADTGSFIDKTSEPELYSYDNSQCNSETNSNSSGLDSGADSGSELDAENPLAIPVMNQVHLESMIPVEDLRVSMQWQYCDICNARIAVDKKFEHLCTHVSPEYVKKCPNENCKLMYITQRKLERHYRMACRYKEKDIASKPIVRKCETCEFETEQYIAFKVHLERHETTTKTFSCPLTSCNMKFTVRQSIDTHLNEHAFKLPVRHQACFICGKRFPVDKIKDHYLEDHKNVKELVECKQCPMIFPERTYLIDHQLAHLNSGVFCDICDTNEDRYSRLAPLREHYLTVHKIGKKFVCEYCGNEFFSKPSLSNHKRVKHCTSATKKSGKIFKCDICFGVEFKSEDAVVSHKIRAHGAEPYFCQICKETFTCRQKLRRHEKHHAGLKVHLKLHKCDHCGKVFRGPKKLQLHMKIQHSQGPVEFEHICSTCGKGYHIRADLHHHTKVAHEGFRYICHICGDSFTETGSLTRHQLVHSGERPFSCDFCGQLFRHRETLNTHLKSHQEKGDRFQPKGPMKERRGVRKKRTPN